MWRWLWRLLYESTAVEFGSAFGLEESVARLQAATKRSAFSAMSETAAVGKVSEKSVRLQRVIPLVGNSFKPFFLGQFQNSSGQTVLAGRFTMLPIVKVFMTVWFGIVTLASVGFLFALKSGTPSPAVLGPFAMIGAGVAMVSLGKWFARNDVAWLSTVIEGALESPGTPGAARVAPAAVDPTVVPLTLKMAAIFLAASGVMAAVSGLTISQHPPLPTGVALPFPALGHWPPVYTALAFALAFGVWRRRSWAWWGFFILLAASGCWSIYTAQAIGNGGPPLAVRIVFGLMGCVVMALWGRWWYGQRRHFILN